MTAPGSGLPALARELIEADFDRRGGELLIGGVGVRDLAGHPGTPLFVYDRRRLEARYRMLVEAVDGFAEVYYSIKANPHPAVAGCFAALGAGLEIASAGEYRLARAAGCDPGRILFAGPGKGRDELREVIAGGIGEVHLESFEEVEICGALTAEIGRPLSVALRVNPAAAAEGGALRMGGRPAPFGFDEEILPEAIAAVERHPGLALDGLHMFVGTQILQAGVLLRQWEYGLELARGMARRLGRPLKRIDLGGGLGIPYHEGQPTLDLRAVRAGAASLAARRRADPMLAPARVLIEPGRWLAGPAGVYLMTVRAVKFSRGRRFVVCDGGMHHHLAASGNLGQAVKRDFPIVAATRLDDDAFAPAQIVGPLCTPLDVLGRQTALPAALAPGDLIAVLQSGAYGLTASPTAFLSRPLPAEVLVCDGDRRLLPPAGSSAGRLDGPQAPRF